MFNCFVVYCNGRQLAIFRTETAAQNFLIMYLPHGHEGKEYSIEGKYIANVGF